MADRLDEISREFAQTLFTRFPQWKQFAKIIAEGTGDGHRWHTHVGPFMGIDIEESVARAMEDIEDFLAERTIVKITFRDGAWCMSSLEYLAAQSKLKPNSTTEFYSWRRTYDEVVDIALAAGQKPIEI